MTTKMTDTKAAELRAKAKGIIEHVATFQSNIVFGVQRDAVDIARAVLDMVPVPPELEQEPLWPEGMAEWEEQYAKPERTLLWRRIGEPNIVIYHNVCSPTQAHRLIVWFKMAAEIEGAIARVEAMRTDYSVGKCEMANVILATRQLCEAHRRFLTEVEEGPTDGN